MQQLCNYKQVFFQINLQAISDSAVDNINLSYIFFFLLMYYLQVQNLQDTFYFLREMSEIKNIYEKHVSKKIKSLIQHYTYIHYILHYTITYNLNDKPARQSRIDRLV